MYIYMALEVPGRPWGGLGDLLYYRESVLPSVSADTFFQAPPRGGPGGSLGGPWGSLGGPWALPGDLLGTQERP